MADDKYAWYNLDYEIKRVQKDKILKEEGLNSFEKGFKGSKLANYGFVIAILLSLLLGSFTFFLGSMVVCIMLVFVDIYKDYKNICKQRREDMIEETKVIDPEKFCYPEYLYQKALQEKRDKEDKKYYEVLERQKGKCEIKENIGSRDDEINLLVEMIENYFYAYKLPPLDIQDYEWDAFFDSLYDELENKGLKYNAYHIISEVIRYTLANTLVNEDKKITIYHFLDSLSYLRGTNSYNGIVPDSFGESDVERLRIAILERIKIRENKKKSKKYGK